MFASDYSLLEGASKIDSIISACIKNRMPAIALTETNNLFSALEFSIAAKNQGVQPIIGSSVSVMVENKNKFKCQIELIVKNEQGYKNLINLLIAAYNNDYHYPFISLSTLLQNNKGLILLTGNAQDGIFNQNLSKNKQFVNIISDIKASFGENLYLEIQRHQLQHEKNIETLILETAYKNNIALVATNNVMFVDKKMHKAHDALICIASNRYVIEKDRRKFTDEYYLKSINKMIELFTDIPEAIHNTVNIARQCTFFPTEKEPTLPTFINNSDVEITTQSLHGLEEKLQYIPDDKKIKYSKRLEYELNIITKMGFSGYFLIVSDFIKWSKKNKIPVGPGRGSGVGSIIAWVLEISDIDPIKFNLVFERFLNPERISMPDFDIDFCQEKRDLVIQYVVNKYGADKVAQIITFGKLQARAVLRDVGRVLHIPYPQIDAICRMIPNNPSHPLTLTEAIELDTNLQRMQAEDNNINSLLTIGKQLEGLNRHASTHAAGIVISNQPLNEIIPIYNDPKSNIPITQFSMKYVEQSGLLKFDFLGLKTLTVIDKICELLAKKNINININTINIEDKKTFELLSKGDSIGIFQLENEFMSQTLQSLCPDSLEDIIVLIALNRPGPMDNIPEYIARKHGEKKCEYLHPSLTQCLKETFGIIIYQEQVMQIAQIMAGYTLGAADILRNAMGKKIQSEMNKQKDIFVRGAVQNNIATSQAKYIFDILAKFAGYGFNKSHATAYAFIAYQTAYLKAHYIIEFIIASMNLEMHDTDKLYIFTQEAKSHNVCIMPPDINNSDIKFTEVDGKISYALAACKNTGENTAFAIVNERKQNGKFINIEDFITRVDKKTINKKSLESLAKAGAFASIHNNAAEILDNVEKIIKYSGNKTLQPTLFGDTKLDLQSIKQFSKKEKLNYEFESIGFYLTEHPILSYKSFLDKKKICYLSKAKNNIQKGEYLVRVAGTVTSMRIKSTAKGKFARIIVSDPDGLTHCFTYNEKIIGQIKDGTTIIADVRIRKQEQDTRIVINDINDLETEYLKYTPIFEIHISNIQDNNTLIEILRSMRMNDAANAYIKAIIYANDKIIEINPKHKFAINPEIIGKLQTLNNIQKIIEI